jgi:hypothetical protein
MKRIIFLFFYFLFSVEFVVYI